MTDSSKRPNTLAEHLERTLRDTIFEYKFKDGGTDLCIVDDIDYAGKNGLEIRMRFVFGDSRVFYRQHFQKHFRPLTEEEIPSKLGEFREDIKSIEQLEAYQKCLEAYDRIRSK